jgi:hypothetical protein
VNPNTYGLDWIIQIYDGERISKLNKIGNDLEDFEKEFTTNKITIDNLDDYKINLNFKNVSQIRHH